jgi:glycosyltransferase involved in cell wall biosynthesis
VAPVKLALVTSGYLPRAGGLGRHVHELALGLTCRGVQVEVLTQDAPRPLPPVSEFDGFVVRRFAAPVGSAHFAVAPGLWDYLRRKAGSFDLIHAHCANTPVALAVARAHPRRFVFTPHASARRRLRWPNTRVTQALVDCAALVICTAVVESELLRQSFPGAADRIEVVPPGLEAAAIRAAKPFAYPGKVVLAIGPLERQKRVDRAIAAMASLDPAFRLAVVGDGPAWHKLLAHAVDLRVSSRVEFVGAVSDEELYRWLRTGHVVVALAEQGSSGLELTEALTAGAPVVASDIPIHREAASYGDGIGVKFVSPAGSPLDIADGIYEAAELSVPLGVRLRLPTWDDVVDRTLSLYTVAIHGAGRPAGPEAALAGTPR